MPRLRVSNFSISLDGFAAGPGQDVENPLGVGGEQIHDWAVATRSWRRTHRLDGGATGVDDDWLARGDRGIGATIIGRNMFGPVRSPWPDEGWRGWWGANPPFHHPVFVLTHHARAPIAMEGGTTFHFVTEEIDAARERALEAAQGQDVRIGGGAAAVRQFLQAGLVDELHLAIVPVLLGAGERLFASGLDDLPRSYECVELVASPAVVHARIARRNG